MSAWDVVTVLEGLAYLFEAAQRPLMRIAVSLVFYYGLYRITVDVLKAHPKRVVTLGQETPHIGKRYPWLSTFRFRQ